MNQMKPNHKPSVVTKKADLSRQYQAVNDLHQFLMEAQWNGSALLGPDPGIRINYRVGRFVKSYLRWFKWKDNLCYIQGQAYWILANWLLYDRTGDGKFRDIAVKCSDYVLERQLDTGAWEYPNPEWKGRIATVEGIWGALGLLATYRQTQRKDYLDGALRWNAFIENHIGYQQVGDELAINYFAHSGGVRVPNNSTNALRFLAELSEVTGDSAYLKRCSGMVTFIGNVQLPTGELPYAVEGAKSGKRREHFQCYQYNAFQCLGLMEYFQLTDDQRVLPQIKKLLEFLVGGVAQDGHTMYACQEPHRQVTYHAAAMGATFIRAGQLGIGNYEQLSRLSYDYVLSKQRSDGSFKYSRYDYGLLSDNRSYPRYLSMIMLHLLLGSGTP